MSRSYLTTTLLLLLLSAPAVSEGAHPLITDDTGTQGRGNKQLELLFEYGWDKANGIKENALSASAALSYGVKDTLDLVLTMPYQFTRTKTEEDTASEDGLSDISMEAKWRVYEKEGLSLALKPGVSLPTGDYKRGLGTGRMSASLLIILSKEYEGYSFHINTGYKRNDTKVGERKDLWNASVAGEVALTKSLTGVGNCGINATADPLAHRHSVFLLGGVIYSVSRSMDLDIGWKEGLSSSETDHTMLWGVTMRF